MRDVNTTRILLGAQNVSPGAREPLKELQGDRKNRPGVQLHQGC